MTSKLFFVKNRPLVFKTIETCSTTKEEHTGRYDFALAPLEAKLSAITGFGHFWVFGLTLD